MEQPETQPMQPETRAALELLAYHPRHSSDPDAVLRFSSVLLGRNDLTHRTFLDIGEADALRLIEALRRRFPDKRAATAAKVVKTMMDRLD